MGNLAQRSFAAGEITPALYARTDQTKYATGLRTCRNFLVQRHGGAANRPGTEYLAPTKNNGAVRLVRFAVSAALQYILELGDRYMRVYSMGAQLSAAGAAAWVTATPYAVADLVTQGGVTYYCTAAHTSGATTQPGIGATWASNWYALTGTIYEIPTPYLPADLATLQVVQSANIMTIVHPNYAPRTLTRLSVTRWKLTVNSFTPTIGAPTNIAAGGGGAGVTTYWAITAVDASGQEGLPAFFSAANKVPSGGTPTTLTWDPVAGAIGYNVYRSTDGRSYGLVGPAGGTPSPVTDTTYTTTTSSEVITSAAGVWYPAGDQVRNPVTAALADKSYDGAYSFSSSMTISCVGGGGAATTRGRVHAYYSRDGEPRVDAGTFEGAPIFGFTSSTQPIGGTIHVPDNGYTNLTIDLVAEVQPGDPGNTVTCALDSTGLPMSWSIIGGGTSDVGSAVDYDVAPPTKQTLFQAVGDYPAAVGYYQQRRLFGNTISNPERVWGSRTGIVDSFATSTPLQDDDALSFQVASREVNAVKHLLDVGRLLIFTESGMTVIGESDNDILTPSTIDPRKRLYYGATDLRPLVLGNAVLFVQAPGSIVRDVMTDVVQSYKSEDLSLFSAHLVDGYSIVDWDLAATPHSIVWAVRDDGVLLGLTYLREQELIGWHRHDTDGAVENVCTVREGREDRLYLVVRRTINGVTKRYVERLASRTITDRTDRRDLFFVDAGLSYDGRNTDPLKTITLSGSADWSTEASLTLTAAGGASPFDEIGVGDAILLYDAAGVELLRIAITAVTSPTVATGYPSIDVPLALQNVATSSWAQAADTLSGLDHLEGKSVAIFADGVVLASPNNAEYLDPIVVAGGSVTLPKPVAVAHVGLPYLCDLETLDIDSPQGASVKDKRMSINAAILELERSLSCFVGAHVPTGADPLEHMDELKLRDATDEYDPIALRTGDAEITIAREWDSNGRLALRVVDPVPVTVLAIIPRGSLPSGG